jgi:hypothetical protein
MLCPSCNNFRLANGEPCPHCHAPSPLVGDALGGNDVSFSNNAWGGSVGPGNEWANNASQMSPLSSSLFWPGPPDPTNEQLSFSQVPQTGNLWMQVMSPSNEAQGAASPGQSLLPVPYQGQPKPNSLMVLPTAFPTIDTSTQGANPLLPALPDSGEAPVYVAPMYTKPRPIIPRYRAISGLISVLVMFSLACTITGYFGWQQPFVRKFFSVYTPPKITPSQNVLPVPSSAIIPGPVWNQAVTSAALGTSIDPKSNQVPFLVNKFTAGQTFYLSCSVNSPKAGKVLTKWFTNGNYYYSFPSGPVLANTSQTAAFPITYHLPAEGKVEIYWTNVDGSNPQLAGTLLFVVEPEP